MRTAAIRTGSAALILVLWTALRHDWVRLGGRHAFPLIGLGSLHAGTLALQNVALDHTAASHVAVLLYLYPVLTAVFAHWWLSGERLTTRAAVTLLSGFLGAAVMLGEASTHPAPVTVVGDALAIGGACLWAMQTVRTKQLISEITPLFLVVSTSAVSSVMLMGASLATEPSGSWWPPSVALASLTYQVVVVDVACRLGWAALLQILPAGVLTGYSFLTPAFGILASFALLGERPSFLLFVGSTLVAASLAMLDRRPRGLTQVHGS